MGNQRILVVEDDPQSRQFLSDILLTEGYSVDTADNFDGARALLDHHEYALVMSDGQLPASFVIDASVRSGAKTAVISAYRFRLRRGRSDGHDTMIRPIRPSELLAAVERHIGKPTEANGDGCAAAKPTADTEQERAYAER